jgi:type II secretory pathway pseudopilin PulG
MRSCSAALLLVVVFVAACGAAPPPPPAHPSAAAPCPAPPPPPAPPPQESLLDRVPGSAVAAVVLRRGALTLPRVFLDGAPAMRQELSAYLTREVGLDPTGVDGVVIWSSTLMPKNGAVFLRLRAPAALKGQRAGQHRGVDLVAVEPTVVAAAVPGGVVIGSPTEVASAIDLAQGATPALASSSPLGFLLRASGPTTDVLAGVDLAGIANPATAAMVKAAGLTTALFTYDRDGLLTVRVEGDPERLGAVKKLFSAGFGVALEQLARSKDKAMRQHQVSEAVGAIVGYHQARKLYEEAQPRVEGRSLVSRYRLPQLSGGEMFLAYVGAAAAVAIPAFTKYVRRSKAAEARQNLRRVATAARAYYEAHRKARRRFTFPATTPWSPAADCCKAGGKCAPDAKTWSHPTWQALGFALADPHYYQYRFVAEGRGPKAHFTVEARGDLDCNGVVGRFTLKGHLGKDGELELGTLEVANETE